MTVDFDDNSMMICAKFSLIYLPWLLVYSFMKRQKKYLIYFDKRSVCPFCNTLSQKLSLSFV